MKHLLSLGVLLAALAFTFIPLSKTVTGKVTDEKGNPIIGASVTIKGTKTSVATNTKGEFSINVMSEKSVLVVTYIGYTKQEVLVGNKQAITIVLKQQQMNLDEVVTIGYSAKQLSSGTPKAEAYYNMSYSLTGRVAGLSVTNSPSTWANGTRTTADSIGVDNNRFNREGYDEIVENPFLKVSNNPLSTFSIDVDAASYSNIRRMINKGELPPHGAVRIEEMINYFTYQYPQPSGDDPFSVNTEIASCPWNGQHKLVLIGLQGKKIDENELPASNLTFLIDVSGSMMEPDKLPLVQASLKLLADQLREQDKVSIVVYAGNAGLVLPSTSGANKIAIKQAINELEAGGSTAGGAGIKLAYKVAKENFIKNGNNRVILCTDGDFNVGASSDAALVELIEEERKTGVFLTVLGYGEGNYQDAKMQKLADKGNGNHAYIDNIGEAKKVLVNEFGGTLFTIAKDVKLQVEFNPSKVQAYRLVGYENRLLAKEDFNNDKKDAGELGSGHTVTALYEVIPAGITDASLDSVDALRYQTPPVATANSHLTKEIMNIKLRYKEPDGDESKLLQFPLTDKEMTINMASENFRFAASVAEFGMLLRNSKYKSSASFQSAMALAQQSLGKDTEGYRKEFVNMIENAALLSGKKKDIVTK